MGAQDFHYLAARIRQGDPTAEAEWHRNMDPQVVRIVRRALGSRTRPSPLTLRIRAEAQRLSATWARLWEEEPEKLAGLLACQIGATLLDQLRSAGPRQQGGVDTVCN
jgi:hypothetical protein